MLRFCSALFRTKSTCLALVSAFSGAQLCASRIHLLIKFGEPGEQPFPMKKSTSLKVSLSPIGFRQKAILISSGQSLMGKKASPFTVLKRSALSLETPRLDKCLTVSRYSRRVAMDSTAQKMHPLVYLEANSVFCTSISLFFLVIVIHLALLIAVPFILKNEIQSHLCIHFSKHKK